MDRKYVEDGKFEKVDFTIQPLPLGDYEGCSFLNCNFADADLSDFHFIDCTFNNCNLSTVQLIRTTFHETVFTHCRLLGLRFHDCNRFLFTGEFDDCQLNFSSFYGMKLRGFQFKECNLQEVDFNEADIGEVVFAQCDFTKATFGNTLMEGADLTTSYNYILDPEHNHIRKAKFSISGTPGLLRKYDIEIS